MDVSPNQLVSRRRVADPVPRERRREPRPHGLEHAAPGGAAAAHRRAARRHRHGARRRARLRRHRRRRRDGVVEQVDATRIVVKADKPSHRRPRPRRRHLQPRQVPALEPEHLHQPAADRRGRRPREGRRRHRRRPVDRDGRARARPQRRRRLHAVGRVQLRGLDPHPRARREARTSSPRSTSRSSSASRATPSSVPRRSRATSRTSATRR